MKRLNVGSNGFMNIPGRILGTPNMVNGLAISIEEVRYCSISKAENGRDAFMYLVPYGRYMRCLKKQK
jgi:hypothetical protein